MAEIIQLKKKNTQIFEIVDENGNKTGESIEFDLESIETPRNYQDCLEMHKNNVRYVQMQFIAIDKKEDHKGKKLMSKNEEEKYEVLREFYDKEMKALDLFLGENGCKKLLNGRKPYYEMFDDINEMLEPILPKLKLSADEIINRVKNKYKEKENDTLE